MTNRHRGQREAAVLVTALALPGLVACGVESAADTSIGPKITIGIDADLPGMGVISRDGVEGFNAEVARYIARDLGYASNQITWKPATAESRDALLRRGQVDMVAASYPISDDRDRSVDFAGPYLVVGRDLLVRASDHRRASDPLDNATVCTVEGTTYARAIRDSFGSGQRITQLAGYDECVTALLTGTVDAIGSNDMILAGLAAQKGGGTLRVLGRRFGTERLGIAVRRGSTELTGKIDAAITHMINDGSWRQALDSSAAAIGYSPDRALNPPTVASPGAAGGANHHQGG